MKINPILVEGTVRSTAEGLATASTGQFSVSTQGILGTTSQVVGDYQTALLGGMVSGTVTTVPSVYGPIGARLTATPGSYFSVSPEAIEFRDCLKANLVTRGMIVHHDTNHDQVKEFEVFVDGMGQLEEKQAITISFSGETTCEQLAEYMLKRYTHFSFGYVTMRRYNDDVNGTVQSLFTLSFFAW